MCGEQRIILGTPAPEDGLFVLRTRLPMKRFCGGDLRFCIDGTDQLFVPVKPDEPFLYLKKLESAGCALRNGQCGVVIKRKPDA